MGTLLTLVAWSLLFVLCWPLALLALVLWPLLWLLSLPLRLGGITFEALFALLRAILLLPARVLGTHATARGRAGGAEQENEEHPHSCGAGGAVITEPTPPPGAVRCLHHRPISTLINGCRRGRGQLRRHRVRLTGCVDGIETVWALARGLPGACPGPALGLPGAIPGIPWT